MENYHSEAYLVGEGAHNVWVKCPLLFDPHPSVLKRRKEKKEKMDFDGKTSKTLFSNKVRNMEYQVQENLLLSLFEVKM